MTLFEYGRNILIVDVGLMFPEADMPGVDYIIPDYDYLRGKEDRIRGVVITHGHLDHIGALPHFLQEFQVPIYATKLTRGLIEVKLRRNLRKQVELHTMAPGDVLKLGPFKVEPYHVSHSIPDAVGLGITTPVGLVVYSGDFKMDHTPVDGWPTDVSKLAEFRGRGVQVLMSDSTNSVHAGPTLSEATLTGALEDVFKRAEGRVIVATFASLISRLQQVMEVSDSFGRKVAIAGTSMVKNVQMAQRLGYLDVPEELIVPLHETNSLPPNEVTILATGSQGEPRSIMGRLATGSHSSLRIREGDTVVLSSHTIPGNEESVHGVINRLFQRGANVVYHPLAPVHVSGHGSQEDQKLLMNILQPEFFIPIHGELRHLKQHALLAQEMGVPKENIAVVENGYVVRVAKDSLEVGERIPGGYIFVDGGLVGEAITEEVIRARESLATGGVCSVVFVYDDERGDLVGKPIVHSQGFATLEVTETLLEGVRDSVRNTLKGIQPGTTWDTVENAVEKTVSDYFWKEARKRPIVIATAVPRP
jgi:ribonuclease J